MPVPVPNLSRIVFSPLSRRYYSSLKGLKYDADIKQRVSSLMKQYEDFVGLTEVKRAQNSVLEAEAKFIETQTLRREKQVEIQAIEVRLKEVRSEIDKTSRGEDRFLQLLTEEHTIIKKENVIQQEFQLYEKAERENFSSLSTALRKSHEQERSQAEKTKYWSVIASVFGAIVGILGTTINNRIRMRELRNLVNDAANPKKVDEMIHDISSMIENQNKHSEKLMSDFQMLIENAPNLNNEAVKKMTLQLKNHDGQIQQIASSIQQIVPNVTVSSSSSGLGAEYMRNLSGNKAVVGGTVTAVLGVLVYFLLL